MGAIVHSRMTAQIEGDFVVFLIGARINRPWRVGRLVRFARAMPRMLAELQRRPELGLLGFEAYGTLRPVIVQYWRSWAHLEAFARSPEATHRPEWAWYNHAIAGRGDFRIWHETYLVRAGEYEAVYHHMPPRGLGRVGRLVPATGRQATGSGRLGRPERGSAPEDPYGGSGP